MTLVQKALLYWRTLRHLKLVQFYGRLLFSLPRPRLKASQPSPALRGPVGHWRQPVARLQSMPAPYHFRFLNHDHRLPEHGGWNDSALEKLWLYNLHYFDDLNAADASSRVALHQSLMHRWIIENPPAAGNGWEPYPTSLRIVNWVKWVFAGNAPPDVCLDSLANQVRWLTKRIEWHLLGNHVFANAKALVFGGLFFEGAEASQWLAQGLRIIARELPEQVLPDGGNFERSPMYHAIFLEDMLDLVNVAQLWPSQVDSEAVANWRETAGRMLIWLEGLSHPDGQIALFNDAAFGIAPDVAALRAYAHRLGLSVAAPARIDAPVLNHWPDSGYIRLASSAAVALLDVAPVGPDYLPGHAHADTLSFELSVFDQRVVVNGGTSRYGVGPERLRERETISHSTVEVADQSSSEVWGGFRVARRAFPFDLQTRQENELLSVACSHDGYRRLPGKPVHRREWRLNETGLVVSDSVNGGDHTAVARFILHPDIQVSAAGANEWTLALPNGQNICVRVKSGQSQVEPAQYAPEFGIVLPTQCLAVKLAAGQAQTQLIWS